MSAEFLPYLKDPIALVGRQIKQRFQDKESGIATWYCGRVIDYCTSKKIHCVVYDGEDNQYHYDLTVDFLNGDLIDTWHNYVQGLVKCINSQQAHIAMYMYRLQPV